MIQRFFVDFDLTSPDSVDFEASDSRMLVAIRQTVECFEIEKTVFDFTLSIVGPRTANNRIHTHRLCKVRIEGFIQNILKPGRHSREVLEDEYLSYRERLLMKAEHMRKKRKRKLTVTEVVTPLTSGLP